MTRPPVHASRPLLLGAVLLALLAGGPAQAAPEQALQQGARAYGRGNYAQAIKLLRPLVYPLIRLSTEAQVIQAYKLLGVSYIFEKDRTEAEKQFMAILALQPDFRFDPLVDPVAAVDLLEDVKRRNAEKLKAIKERERREAERRRIEEQRRRDEERRRALVAGQGIDVIERTIVKHPYWINFVPFGAGQLQNGHRRKAFALMGTQLTLGALSLGTALGLRFAYPDGRVPAAEYDRARGLAIAQVASGALFFATIAYGIIDALVYHRPEHVTERRTRRKLDLTPTPGPGTAGLGLGMRF